MSTLLSLRARLLFGAVLWTVGLFGLAGVIMRTLMLWPSPTRRSIFHRLFMLTRRSSSIVAWLAWWRAWPRSGAACRRSTSCGRGSSAVRDGRDRRLDGDYPTEVQPLVDDLNALLDQREQHGQPRAEPRPATWRTA